MKKSMTVNEILLEIKSIESLLTGTITYKYSPCGKASCMCSTNPEKWHGPYYIWTRKENGKTITRSLNKKQVAYCKKAIRNMKKIQKLINLWRKTSEKAIKELK